MEAKAKLKGIANDNAVAVLPWIRTQALRIVMKPPCFSIADVTKARLQTTYALARMMEKSMAPMAERRSMDSGEERAKTSKQLKQMARKKKHVAFAASMTNELQSWVMRSGLKS